MASVNKWIGIGNLGRDPELRKTPSGTSVCSFSMATTKKLKDGEKKTEWHNIVVRNKLAEICEKYLSKGDRVFIEGKIKTRQWEQDGIKKYSTEIHALDMTFLTTKKDLNNPSGPETAERIERKSTGMSTMEDPTDDLPF